MSKCRKQSARRRKQLTTAVMAKPEIGAEGMTKVRSVNGSRPVKGEITGAVYRFDERKVLFVDNRDMIFMLGADYRLSEQ